MISPQESWERARTRTDSDVLELLDAEMERGSLRIVPEGDRPDMIAGGSWPSRTLGARRAVCWGCKCYVGLSPNSGAAMVDRWPDVPIVCFDCAAALAQEEE